MKLKHNFCILSLLLIGFSEGQILSPAIKKSTFEVGYTQKWFHRKMEPGYLTGIDWYSGTVLLRYGITRWFTITIEGIVSPYVKEKISDSNDRVYVIGAGIACRVLQFNTRQIGASFQYIEHFWFDQSETRYHSNTRGVLGAIQFTQRFSISNQEIMGWIAPAYIYDESIQYPYGQSLGLKDKSFNNFGFALGCDAVLIHRLSSFVHFVYADFFQPRVGIGCRFW
ncbi:MAG: hypothetical protein ACPL28_12305 [bacterium]